MNLPDGEGLVWPEDDADPRPPTRDDFRATDVEADEPACDVDDEAANAGTENYRKYLNK